MKNSDDNSGKFFIDIELGKAYLEQGDYDKAIKILNNASKLNYKSTENNKYAALLLAKSHRYKGEYDSAIEELMQLSKYEYKDIEVHKELVINYKKKGEYGLCIEEFKKMVNMATESEEQELHIELGRLYREFKKYSSAIREFKKASEIGGSNDEIHFELGLVYEQSRNHKRAFKEFEKALVLNPKNGRVYASLGRMYERNGEFDKAIQEYELALRYNYHDIEVYKELSRTYYKTGNTDKAINQLEQAVSNGVVEDDIYIKLGRLYREQRKFDMSLKMFNTVLKLGTNKKTKFFKNKILNEIEISQQKLTLSSMPRMIDIELFSDDNSPISKNVFVEIKRVLPYLQQITWRGDNILKSACMKEILKTASKYTQLCQCIHIEDGFLDEDVIRILAPGTSLLSCYIKGINRKTYEYKKNMNFDDFINNLEVIKKYRKKYQYKMGAMIILNISKSNIFEIEGSIEFISKYNFDGVVVIIDSNINKKNIERQLYSATIKAQNSKIAFQIVYPFQENSVAKRKNNIKISREILCYWPWQSLYISKDGKVRPFECCLQAVGDLKQKKLHEIWNSREIQLYRRKILDNEVINFCNKKCCTGIVDRVGLGFR